MSVRVPLRSLALVPLLLGGTAMAQQNLVQTPLEGSAIPQFVQALPRLNLTPPPGAPGLPVATGIPVVIPGDSPLQLRMCEFKAQVLPPPLPSTWVWGYVAGSACPAAGTIQDTYLGPVIVAQRGTPTSVTFVNDLGRADATHVLAYRYSVDQTLHWADPLGLVPGAPGMNRCAMIGGVPAFLSPCSLTYAGPVPAVPHLHGGEVPPELDGGPEAWFTSDGTAKGGSYYTSVGGPANQTTYRYPNLQEAGPLWFHDHTLGATRLNVYAGLAGAYYLADPGANLPANFPSVAEIIPLVLQDRMFDTNGQLFFPADSAGGVLYALNPEHPYWVPEFIGDAVVVNGKAWPFLNLEPKRYRFLFLNGSNARTYDLSITPGAQMWVVGNDGGLLDAAAAVTNLVLMPGERYEVIIDFTRVKPGTSLVLRNIARAPYPGGAPPRGTTTGQILKINVGACAAGGACGAADPTFNPAANPTIRGSPIVRLVSAAGQPASTPAVKRLLTLNEVMGMPPKGAIDPVTGLATNYPGGPLEILVNNTRWSGENTMAPRPYGDFTSFPTAPMATMVSELPKEGDTELWEIVNLTADAHPIHLHLVQFQILNRQAFDTRGYNAAYAAAFPGVTGNAMCPAGTFCPGFGPPGDYNVATASGYVGGNPEVRPFLKGAATPPAAQETGWKDTLMAPPGMVTRFVVRWSPTSAALGASGQAAAYPFDPSGGGRFGYVWHCHIIDHEDNEMMRPDYVTPIATATRTYLKGTHY